MDAARLHYIVQKVLDEIGSQKIAGRLNALVATLKALAETPTQEAEASVNAALADLVEALSTCPSNRFSTSFSHVMRDIGADQQTGEGLRGRVTPIFDARPFLAANAQAALQKIVKRFTTFADDLAALAKGLKSAGVEPHAPPPNVFELGIILPDELTQRHLESIGKEFLAWNLNLRPIVEARTGKSPPIELRGTSTGSLSFFLELDPQIAYDICRILVGLGVFLQGAAKLVAAMTNIIESGVDKDAIELIVKKTQATSEEEALKRLTEDLLSNHPGGKGMDERKNELRNAISMSLNFILDRLRKNVLVEVSPPENTGDLPDEQEINEQLAGAPRDRIPEDLIHSLAVATAMTKQIAAENAKSKPKQISDARKKEEPPSSEGKKSETKDGEPPEAAS